MSEVIYAGNPAVNRPLQIALNRWLMFMGVKPLLIPDGIFGDETWLRLRQVIAGFFGFGEALWSAIFDNPGIIADQPETFSSREDLVQAFADALNVQADTLGLAQASTYTYPAPTLPAGAPKATKQQLDDAKAKMASLGISTDLGGANTLLWVFAGLLVAGAAGAWWLSHKSPAPRRRRR